MKIVDTTTTVTRTIRGVNGWYAQEYDDGRWFVGCVDGTQRVIGGTSASPTRLREMRDFIDALLSEVDA